MSIISLHKQLLLFSACISIIIVVKLKTKLRFRATANWLLYILKEYPQYIVYFSKIYYHTKLNYLTLHNLKVSYLNNLS
jgi:hypothetical protein